MGVSIVEWLLNFGLGGLIIFLIVTGVLVPGFIYKELQRNVEKLSDALSVERQRNADLQQMAATGAKALDALAQVAQEHRALRSGPPDNSVAPQAVIPPSGGTGTS